MNYFNTPFPTSKTYPLSPVAIVQATHPRVAPVLKRCATKLATMNVAGIHHVTYTRDLMVEQLQSVGKRSAEADQVGLSNKAGVYIAHTDDGRQIYVGSTNNLRSRIQGHLAEDSIFVTSRRVFGEEVIGLMVIEMPSHEDARTLESFINDMMDYDYLININRVGTKSEKANSYDRAYNNQLSCFFLDDRRLTLNAAKQAIFHKRRSMHALEFRPQVESTNMAANWAWFERLQTALSQA